MLLGKGTGYRNNCGSLIDDLKIPGCVTQVNIDHVIGRFNRLFAIIALPGPVVEALRGLSAFASSLHPSADPFFDKLPLPSLAEIQAPNNTTVKYLEH